MMLRMIGMTINIIIVNSIKLTFFVVLLNVCKIEAADGMINAKEYEIIFSGIFQQSVPLT